MTAGDVLFELTRDDLTEMNITSIGDKKRVLKAIEQLRIDANSRASMSIDMAVIGSSPLCVKEQGADRVAMRPLDLLDVDSEQELLRRAINDSKRACSYWFSYGSLESVSHIMQLGCHVLHFTGHTNANGKMLLESPCGAGTELCVNALCDLFRSGAASSSGGHGGGGEKGAPCRMVVLCSCNSRALAGALYVGSLATRLFI
jgi:hypothetical protein